eukprot:TRINITY_DN3361_c0_g1_i1.p1 TRINITY_DN3361_c0_g1~~TRINITY_DN3361_c0_g1_i1.p1  ORF type:complete len:169 (-),score=46.11 TRINITY_DN3361_c0_g1_i1:531-977(-)
MCIRDSAYTDDECPVCKMNVFVSSSMKILNSVCGHKLCDSCHRQTFMRSMEAKCPICRRTLRRADYSTKSPEEMEFEKENKIRLEILQMQFRYHHLLIAYCSPVIYLRCRYNEKREDFQTEDSWNDYLEEIEDISEFNEFAIVVFVID